ncbi:hypothetical protein ABPG72_020906 [Tetrahymena utriculariae]
MVIGTSSSIVLRYPFFKLRGSISKSEELDIFAWGADYGKNLFDVIDTICQVEIRVNLQKKLVTFTDYPEYNHIYQMNLENMTDEDYSFGVYSQSLGDAYEIEIATYSIDYSNFLFRK